MVKDLSTTQKQAIASFREKHGTAAKGDALYEEPECRKLTAAQRENLRVLGATLERELCNGHNKKKK